MEEETVDVLIRDIPDHLYEHIKRRARQKGMSMNQYVLRLIELEVTWQRMKRISQREERKVKRRLESVRQKHRAGDEKL